MIAAEVAAPDHGKIRRWRFLVIQGDARARFGAVMARSLGRRDKEASPQKLEFEKNKAMRAPTLVVVVATPKDNPKVPEVEQIVAVGAATQNFLVAAHALGYGAFWRTGAVAYDAEVKHELGLNDKDTIVGILYVGSVRAPRMPRPIQTREVVKAWPT